MALPEFFVLVLTAAAFQAFCSYRVARFIAGCPEDERIWIDRTKFRRAILIAGGLLTWIGLFIWGIGSLIVEEGNVYSDAYYDEDDGGFYW